MRKDGWIARLIGWAVVVGLVWFSVSYFASCSTNSYGCY